MSLQQFLTRLIGWCVAPLLVLAAVLSTQYVRQAQALFDLQARQVAHAFSDLLENSEPPQAPKVMRAADLKPSQQAELQKRLDSVALPPEWRLSLLDDSQAVIVQRGGSPALKTDTRNDDLPWRFVTRQVSQPWTIALEIPRQAYRAPMLESLLQMLLALLSATVAAVLGGRWVSRSLTQSLNSLLHKTATPDAPASLITEVSQIRSQLDESLRLRHQAQVQLAASESGLRKAQRLAKLGHWRWALPSGQVEWSAEIFEFFGCDPQGAALDFEAFKQRLTPASWTRLAPLVDAILAQSPAHACDLEIVRSDGTHRWITLRGKGTCGADGTVIEIHGTMQDITQSRQISERLHLSDLALQAISQGVLMTNAQGQIISSNQAFFTITGFPEAEILGQTCHFVQGPLTDPATRLRLREALQNQEAFSGELLNYRRDGSTFWNELSITPILDNQRQLSHFIGIIRDISARKRIELELQENQVALEQTVASRTAELTQTTRMAQLGVWHFDLQDLDTLQNNPMSWSQEMYRLLDYAPSDPPQINVELFFARVHPNDQPAFQSCLAQAMKRRSPWQTKYRLLQTDGSVRWVMETGAFVFDSHGAPTSMHGTVKDITERRRIELQLRDSEASLHQALRHARAGWYEGNIKTRDEVWSEEYWALVGLSPNAIPASYDAWLASVHPDDRDHASAQSHAAISKHTDYEIEWRVNLPDDQPARWLLDRCQPVQEPDGQVLRYRGVVIDITERKQAELGQARYLERLEDRVAERTAELSLAQDRQRRLNRALRLLSECNGAMVRATSKQQLLDDLCQLIINTGGYRMSWVGAVEHDEAKSISMLAHAGAYADYFQAAPVSWDDAQASGRGPLGTAVRTCTTQVNTDYASPDMALWREAAQQRGYRASLALPLLIDQQVWGVLALYSGEPRTFSEAEVQLLEELASNITFGLQSLRNRTELDHHRQQLEDRVAARTHEIALLNTALEAKAHDAETASRAKSTFLASMSHELRTPLNAVVGLTGLLTESLTERRQRDYADKIQLSAKALSALINDILDYAKIEASAMVLDHAPFSLSAILRVAAAVVSVGVRDKPIEVVFDVDASAPDALLGDGLRLQQILLNLCSNAIKFTESGVIVVLVRCLSIHPDQATLLFSVRDTGIGIPSAQLGAIFDVFTQADRATSRLYGGTGLGLTISARLADLMGSTIEVDSTLNEGSEFRFTLTLDRASEVPATGGPEDLSGLKVLVIDDHALARTVLLQTCATLGWHAQGADSAEAGLQALRTSVAHDADYDLVLLDWRMPGTDGLVMLRRAYAASDIRLPMVVLMTSVHELALAAAASDDLTLDGITTKPVTPDSLREAVARAFAGDFQDSLPVPQGTEQRLKGMRLLVADDNDINLDLVAHILTHAGAEVTTVVNGQQAVEMLRPPHVHFDAVLMDIQMPVMDGYEATRQIREQLGRIHLPIIAVTAFAQPEDFEKSRAAGMVGHVVKPLDVNVLLDILVKHRATKPSDARPSAEVTSHTPPPVLNLAAARKAFGGDSAPYLVMLRKFIAQHGDDALEATRLWQTQTPTSRQAAAQRVHDLRGVAGILYATPLSLCAAATEDAMRSPTSTDMAPLLEQLQTAMAQVIAAVVVLESKPPNA